MSRRSLFLTVLAGASLWSAAALGKGFFDAPKDTLEGSLQKAHAAYMQKNYAAMTDALRDVLSDPGADTVARQGAFALLQKANAETNGHLPADWKLPAGVRNMKFKQYRKEERDGVTFAASLQATMQVPDAVAEVRVTRWPSEVLLDKQAGVGEWEITHDEDGYSFDLYAGDKAEPLADGLYTIDMELKDGSRTAGWFVLSDLEASASPALEAPAVGETSHDPTPELRWQDFRSPEYKPYESRYLTIAVTELKGADTSWSNPAWDLYEADPTRTSVVVDKPLADGKYWAMVTYQEQRMFGPLKLRRCARVGRYFYVKAK